MPRTSGDDALIAPAGLVREVRHYEETRLLEVTCGGCERQFLAIQVEPVSIDALRVEDVAEAVQQLAWARSSAPSRYTGLRNALAEV